MKPEGKHLSPIIAIHLTGLLFLAAAFAVNPYKIAQSFFSDEAVYYTMAYSLAEDRDLEFHLTDLKRVYQESSAGPQGIILKLNERDGTIVFGKGYLYPLVAAPFVKLFNTNGFFLLNALLLWLNLLCAYRFCLSIMSRASAALFTFFYFLANASLIYLYWMTPEYFSMSLVCYGFFFFTAAESLKSSRKVFSSPYNYLIAAVFFGFATFAKPPNALLIIPLGIWLLSRKKLPAALTALAIYIFVTLASFGVNVYFTGEWNYQGGRRALFYDHFPYERPGVSEFAPFSRKKPIEAMVQPPFYMEAFLHNWIYFFFGRFSGLAIYFFPMFLCIVYFLLSKKNSLSIAIYIAGWLSILYYMLGLPWNYFGGSGTIGNRYLMNAFPVFLFALQNEPPRKVLAGGLMISLLLISVFLATPVRSSFDVAFHQKRGLLRSLPLEQSLLGDLPINNNPSARRVYFDQPANYFVYFIDDNTYYKETWNQVSGFWVKGERTAEFVLRAFRPAKKITMRLKSLVANHRISISVNGKDSSVHLKEPVFYEAELILPEPFPYDRDNTGATYLYHFKIRSPSGVITRENTTEERYLGAFLRLELPEVGKQEVHDGSPGD